MKYPTQYSFHTRKSKSLLLRFSRNLQANYKHACLSFLFCLSPIFRQTQGLRIKTFICQHCFLSSDRLCHLINSKIYTLHLKRQVDEGIMVWSPFCLRQSFLRKRRLRSLIKHFMLLFVHLF